jgi:prophage antirepressor-like protein
MQRECSKQCGAVLPASNPNRYCTECRRVYQQEYRARKKAEKQAIKAKAVQEAMDALCSGAANMPEQTVHVAAETIRVQPRVLPVITEPDELDRVSAPQSDQAVTPFHFDEQQQKLMAFGRAVPYLLMGAGQVWFRGKSLADSLGYAEPGRAVRDHVPDEYKLSYEDLLKSGGGAAPPLDLQPSHNTTTAIWIDEGGLYELAFKSQRPEAVAFRRWVTREVLPTIRKTGGYGMQSGDAKYNVLLEKISNIEARLDEVVGAKRKKAESRTTKAAELRSTVRLGMLEWKRREGHFAG